MRRARTLVVWLIVAVGGTVALAPPLSAHEVSERAARALMTSRVALHPDMLQAVGSARYEALRRRIGSRPLYVVILPDVPGLTAREELAEVAARHGGEGIYLLTLGDGMAAVVQGRSDVSRTDVARVLDGVSNSDGDVAHRVHRAVTGLLDVLAGREPNAVADMGGGFAGGVTAAAAGFLVLLTGLAALLRYRIGRS